MNSYVPGQRAKCPHCRVTVLFERAVVRNLQGTGYSALENMIIDAPREDLFVSSAACPACGRPVISLSLDLHGDFRLIYPLETGRDPVPAEVPDFIAKDYSEAALVIGLSAKASAALSRRCLQSVLREQGFNQKDLWQQIDAAVAVLPSYIAENVDAIRHIGNFAAHPMKSVSSAEVVDVEPGEAEWNLDVLDELFDFYYVQPTRARAKRDALNAKLVDVGKRPMNS